MKFIGLDKISKEKRKDLVLVVLVTAGILSGLGFGLIKYQYSSLASLENKRAEVNRQLEEMHNLVRRAELTKNELAISRAHLTKLEKDMASRDIYIWMIDTLRRFKQSYKVEIPQVGQPAIGDVSLLSKFPYKQAALSVSGSARYHELGRFVSDLENQYPHFRVLNLEVTPASAAGEMGLLSFKFDIVALVNPNTR